MFRFLIIFKRYRILLKASQNVPPVSRVTSCEDFSHRNRREGNFISSHQMVVTWQPLCDSLKKSYFSQFLSVTHVNILLSLRTNFDWITLTLHVLRILTEYTIRVILASFLPVLLFIYSSKSRLGRAILNLFFIISITVWHPLFHQYTKCQNWFIAVDICQVRLELHVLIQF